MNQEQINAIALSIAEEMPEFLWRESCKCEEGITEEQCVKFARRVLERVKKFEQGGVIAVESLERQRDKLLAALKRAERETGFINCQELSEVIAEVEAMK